jgi:hypothetical protein
MKVEKYEKGLRERNILNLTYAGKKALDLQKTKCALHSELFAFTLGTFP